MYGWYLFTVGLHVLLCIFLVLIILLQPGKGGDVGAAFGGGGGGAQMFGPRGPASYLQRATTGVAILFMVTSVTLALFSTMGWHNSGGVEDVVQSVEELGGFFREEVGDETPEVENSP